MQFMQKLRTLFFSLFILYSVVYPTLAQKKATSNNKQSVRNFGMEILENVPPIICYMSETSGNQRIPPPERLRSLANGRTEQTNIVVRYSANFPEDARKAFEFAVDIWRKLLTSPVQINVQANWSPLGVSTLGSASPETYFRNPLLPQFPTWYPIVLVEKILGRNLNGTDPDIVANFSSNNDSWYFGTDGNVRSNQTDFVTVVLHELGHGLGFAGFQNVQSGNGSIGTSAMGSTILVPSIYDAYVANRTGQFLADTTVFRNPSTTLATQLTSDEIFFQSDYVTQKNKGERPKLYAPRTFDRGSSISHLDTRTYTNTDNALMRHSIARGESIQDPGAIMLNIFSEIGWVLTQLRHTPIESSDRVQRPIDFKVQLVSDTVVDFRRYTVELVYSEDRFRTAPKREVMTLGTNGEFNAQLPAPNGEKEYSYYFSAKTAGGKEISLPATTSTIPFRFTVAEDNEPPVITHIPDGFILETTDTLLIGANITDKLGIDTAYLEYSINDQMRPAIPLFDLGFNSFGNFIVFPAGSLRAGGSLKYRIVAFDISSKRNRAVSPASDFYTVKIEGFGDPRVSYENNFNMPSEDFIGNAYRIEQPDGFMNGAIHSDHPYKDGSGTNDESNYIYQLKFPITVKDKDAFIRFDEIVLVEPGERGTVFGDAEFWDYVIVEASRDRGRTWVSLLDGYDSRANADWLSAYNRRIVDNNSTTIGTPSLFRPRVINMLDKLRANETVLLRFRLFADQAAHGWGWAIDNLQIQSGVVGLDDYIFSKEDVNVYPNPNAGSFMIYGQFKKNVKQLKTVVTDLAGRQIYEDLTAVRGLIYQQNISLPELSAGMYIVQLYIDGNLLTKKVMIQP
jgi:hypothetical protein